MKLDLLLRNADIITMDERRPHATSMGIWQGRVVGLDEDLFGLDAVEVLDLAGATVTPGFIDAHCHTTWFGLGLGELDVSAARGLNQLYALLEAGMAADGAADGAADAGAPSFCVRAAGASGSDTACLARLPVGAKNLRYYRSHSLDQTNGAIQNLVFIQHGNNRNAWDYYDLLAAAAIARDPLHTAVVAPHFQASGNACASGPDVVDAGDLDYACSDWKEGLLDKSGSIDSFAALDAGSSSTAT
ncbi:MAG TPA: amidohydrolase family protein [Labilithrix sp.]|nr:amidohydrolase family protein [Labilithrix sp.]